MMPNQSHTESPSSNGGASSPGDSTANVQARIAHVADEVPAQARAVVHDVKAQLRETTQRTLGDVRIQADDGTTRAAQGLRDLSTRAQALADGRTDEAGNVGELVSTFARQAADVAQRLEIGGAQGLLDDALRFARNRPITFLALAVGAGFLAGRLVRTGAEVTSNDDTDDHATATIDDPTAIIEDQNIAVFA